MTSLSKSEPDLLKASILILGITGLFYFFFGVLPERYSSEPTQNNKCKYITKEVQTIKKINGGIASIETEMVRGCEYQDGTFIPAPELPHEN